MKLLLICHSSEKSGGGEDDFQRITSHLSKKYTIYSAFPEGDRQEEFSKNALEYFHIPHKHFPLMGLNLRYFISRFFIKNLFITISNLTKFLNKNKDLDLVILNSSVCFIEALILFFYNIPYIIFIREKINPRTFRKLLYKLYNNSAVKIITVSEYLKTIFLEDVKSEKIVVLNAPIEEEFYDSVKLKFENDIKKNENNKFVISQVGSVCHLKGQDITVRALEKLYEDKKHIDKMILLRLIGRFHDDNYYRDLNAATNRVEDRWKIEYTGELNKKELIKNLINSDCIVISSREEGASLVFSEGLFLEIPVIASNVADLANMIENYQTGLIFEVEDYSKLSEYIYELYTSANIKNILVKNSKSTYYKYFNLNRNMEKLEKIIEDCKSNF